MPHDAVEKAVAMGESEIENYRMNFSLLELMRVNGQRPADNSLEKGGVFSYETKTIGEIEFSLYRVDDEVTAAEARREQEDD